MPLFKAHLEEMEVILIDSATSGWKWASPWYEQRVEACNEISGGEYITTITKAIIEYFIDNPIDSELIALCNKVRAKLVF